MEEMEIENVRTFERCEKVDFASVGDEIGVEECSRFSEEK